MILWSGGRICEKSKGIGTSESEIIQMFQPKLEEVCCLCYKWSGFDVAVYVRTSDEKTASVLG